MLWFDEDFKQELKNKAEMDQVIADLKYRLRRVVITNTILACFVIAALAGALFITMKG